MRITEHTFSTKPPVTLPVIHFKGKKKGKTGFISGGIHGDEINGMILVKKFVENFQRYKLEEKLQGELIIFPILNPTGFERAQRKAEPDKVDMNRAFPGKKTGTFSQQFAHELFHKFLSKADFGIDCHDAGSQSSLLPHTRVGGCNGEEDSPTHNLGRLFGTEIIIERKGHPGMMALETFKKFKKPLVTVEIGGAKHIFEPFLKQGVEGIKNILRFYEMLPGKVKMPQKQFILKTRFGIKAGSAGIIKLNIELGDFVHAGDKIGSIYHPQTFKENTIIAPMCGRVFSLHDHQIIKGNGIMYSILESKDCHVERTTTSKFKELKRISVEKIVM